MISGGICAGQKAIVYLEQALASDLKTYVEDHPNVATERNNLGGAWESLDETQKAISYFEQELAIMEKRLGKDHHQYESGTK